MPLVMLCPTCKGLCCRIDGFPVSHGNAWRITPRSHICLDCEEGTYEICGDPEPFIRERSFAEERADVLAYLLAVTTDCKECMDEAVVRLARQIARGEHVGASKKASDKV